MLLDLIKKEKRVVIILTIGITMITLLLSLLQPLEYSATNRLLVIQPVPVNSDAFSALKSTERTTDQLSQVIYTTSFFEKVANSGFNIDMSYFKVDEKKKRKQWEKMVETNVIRGYGMIEIKAYHENQAQALELNRAISYVLNTSAWEYLGQGELRLKEVDKTLVSDWPVRPNFILFGMLGIVLGFISSVVYLLLDLPRDIFAPKKVTEVQPQIKNSDEDVFANPLDLNPASSSTINFPKLG